MLSMHRLDLIVCLECQASISTTCNPATRLGSWLLEPAAEYKVETPLFFLLRVNVKQPGSVYLAPVVGGNLLIFYPLSPSLLYSAGALHLSISIQINSVLPGNLSTDDEKQLLPEQRITQYS